MTTEPPGTLRPTGPGPQRRPDSSMSLLVDMMTHTLDEGYAERAAARARRAHGAPDSPAVGAGRQHRAGPLVGLVAVGVLTGTAIEQVSDRSEAHQGLRSSLAEQVQARTRQSDALAARAGVLRDDVTTVRERALGVGAAGRSAARELAVLGAATATTTVRGPGIVVTLTDADTGADTGAVTGGADQPDPARGGTVEQGRVGDQDLQDVVNGLWAAGAEALSVNGQRLTALSAIRSAGESVLVDLRPLSPPYVVRAVGDGAQLEVDFVDGPSGRRLTTLTSLYGIGVDVRRADTLTLPAAAVPVLRHAVPVPSGSPPGRPAASPATPSAGPGAVPS